MSGGNDRDHKLHIRMLGDFAVQYGGEGVSLGKNAGAKFLSFLQMLYLAGPEGVPREEIISSLFGGDELANVTNSLNNLVYQTRKQLKKSNLPAESGIGKTADRYFWTSELPVVTDVDQFLQALAACEEDSEQSGLERVVALYRGDLLPQTTDVPYINSRRDALRTSFKETVRQLAVLYRENSDADALIRLYSNAAEVTESENADLETALILTLIDAGHPHDAFRCYDRAIRLYQSKGTGNIPAELELCARRLSALQGEGDTFDLKTQLLGVVRASSDDADEDPEGAFYCNYPSFIDEVKLLRRNLSRDPRPVTLMLLTLVDYEGKPLRMEKKQVHYSGLLGESIREALRVGDSYTRHDGTGFLVLLPGADEENAVTIYERIARRVREKAGTNVGVRYRKLALSDLNND